MSKKFSTAAIHQFLNGSQYVELCQYLNMTEEEARKHIRQRFEDLKNVHPSFLRDWKERIVIVPPKRTKLPRVKAGEKVEGKVYVEGTLRNRYRFHGNKPVEGTPTPPDPALRESNKRKGKRV